MQVTELSGDGFYYNRVGQRCFEAGDNGFSNEQLALAYTLETNTFLTADETQELVDFYWLEYTPSQAIQTFLNQSVWDELQPNMPEAFSF